MPSSVIASFTYNEESCTLRVNFLSGNVYEYLHVPAEVFGLMKAAKSKGTFLNKFIKGHFEYIRTMESDI